MKEEMTEKTIPAAEPERQYYFIEEDRKYIDKLKKETGHSLECSATTFGCQMNARDTEKILGILKQIGFEESESENTDFVIYNTCTVRENANQKVYGHLGFMKKLKEKNPDMIIALCGCMMQEAGVVEKIRQSYGFVDIIFGTHNIFKLAELINELFREREAAKRAAAAATQRKQAADPAAKPVKSKHRMVVDIWEGTEQIVEKLPQERTYSFKAGVNIMFGCNNFCSYCIVPYVRGRERSRKPEDILDEIYGLSKEGVTEVMLLGQNVNSYGRSFTPPLSFANLLRRIQEIDGIRRIRFMTSHPKDLSEELIEVMAESDKICSHLHLPVQSGSSEILKRMNRSYTREQYLRLVERIRTAVPDIALTTDIIVGFPGETEEDFEQTLELVEEVQYSAAYTFQYSRRSGTPAASMEGQLTPEVMKERFDRLLAAVQHSSEVFTSKMTGTVQEVLVEEIGKQDGQTQAYLTGRLSNNLLVHFYGNAELLGGYIPVLLKENKGFYYIGEMV